MASGSPSKRFYEAASLAAAASGGFEVRLDGRPLRTPAGAALALPGRALARALADEWAAQGARIQPHAMPLTSLACTAIDGIAGQRQAAIGELLEFAETDLLCYRAAHPEALVLRQAETWQPLLDWAALSLDAPLTVTRGILPIAQPEASLAALRRAVEALSDLKLTALDCAARAAGSLIVALALSRDQCGASEAFEAAELDASFEIERWGEDPEATRRRDGVLADLTAAAQLFRLLQAAAEEP